MQIRWRMRHSWCRGGKAPSPNNSEGSNQGCWRLRRLLQPCSSPLLSRGIGVTRVEKESSHFNEWSSLSEPEQRVITYWVDTTEWALFPWRWSPRAGRRAGGRRRGGVEKVRGSSYSVPYFVTGYDISGLHSLTKPRSMVEHHWREGH